LLCFESFTSNTFLFFGVEIHTRTILWSEIIALPILSIKRHENISW
jgi:hypothetical protein